MSARFRKTGRYTNVVCCVLEIPPSLQPFGFEGGARWCHVVPFQGDAEDPTFDTLPRVEGGAFKGAPLFYTPTLCPPLWWSGVAPRVGDTDSHAFAWPLELGIWTPTLWRGPLSWGYGLPRFGVAP